MTTGVVWCRLPVESGGLLVLHVERSEGLDWHVQHARCGVCDGPDWYCIYWYRFEREGVRSYLRDLRRQRWCTPSMLEAVQRFGGRWLPLEVR